MRALFAALFCATLRATVDFQKFFEGPAARLVAAVTDWQISGDAQGFRRLRCGG
ncbi:MAG: hypothetical protein ACE369_07820 [Roseovarius sp.]